MNEILYFAKNLKLDELIDPPRLDHIMNIHTRMGFDTGERVYNFLKTVFRTKDLDLDTLKIGDSEAPLYIIASDITNTKIVIFNEFMYCKIWIVIRPFKTTTIFT